MFLMGSQTEVLCWDLQHILEFDAGAMEALGLTIEELEEYEGDWHELIAEKQLYGFLIQVSTPVPFGFKEGNLNDCTNSWGCCRVEWFYVENLADMVEHVQKFRKDVKQDAYDKQFAEEVTG
jgi:hypothetical protein